MDLQGTVKEALSALYHHPDDAVRARADRWLQEFQHTIDAWQVTPTTPPHPFPLSPISNWCSVERLSDWSCLEHFIGRLIALWSGMLAFAAFTWLENGVI